jgi:hypothetical protein
MTLSDFILAFKALEKDTKGKCFYCGTQTERGGLKQSAAIFMTRDHVIPTSAKGGDRRANKVVCCRKCNNIKEDLTLHEFKRRSGIAVFFAETLLGHRIDDLSDIEEITVSILNTRKIEGRSIKFNGKPEIRTRIASAQDFLPSSPYDLASNQ